MNLLIRLWILAEALVLAVGQGQQSFGGGQQRSQESQTIVDRAQTVGAQAAGSVGGSGNGSSSVTVTAGSSSGTGNGGSRIGNSEVTIQQGSDCPLPCRHNTQCVEGAKDRTSHPDNLDIDSNNMPFPQLFDQYYCDCPPGLTGQLCHQAYQSCNDNQHACLNGGTCLPGFMDAFDNEQFYCDCSTAVVDGKRYAGKFCQAVAVEVCDKEEAAQAFSPIVTERPHAFCVHGGRCKRDWKESITEPCNCLPGFEGTYCEYETGQEPVCDLRCFNGGKCQIGHKGYVKQYADFFETNQEFQHCVCPEGYYGVNCEIEGKPCGDKHCFNGGSCVEKEEPNGDVRHYCDCTDATTDEVSYAGQYCEAASTAFCTKLPDHNGHQFCVNGGTCKSDSHLGCDCPDDFVGPICEFQDSQLEYTECTLDCHNDGICRKGAKDIGLLAKFGVNQNFLNTTYRGDFEHCVCPKGYVGVECEFQMEVCPGGLHVCMNGGECVAVRDEDDLHFECDCSGANTPFARYAGQYCEYESTDFCTLDGTKAPRGKSKDAFCVNFGECLDKVENGERHPGCDCPPGYAGDHCEYFDAVLASTGDGLSGGIIAVVVVAVLVGATIAAVFLLAVHRRQKSRVLTSMWPGKFAPAPTMAAIQSLDPLTTGGSSSGSASISSGSENSSESPESAVSNSHSSAGSSSSAHRVSVTVNDATGAVALMKEPPLTMPSEVEVAGQATLELESSSQSQDSATPDGEEGYMDEVEIL